MRWKSLKLLIVSAIGGLAWCGSSIFLSSCSVTKPNLFAPENGSEDFFDHDFEVGVNWIGYYSEDVYAKISIPYLYKNYVNYNEGKKQFGKTESLTIDFSFNNVDRCPVNIKSQAFNIEIDWYVNHTSIHKKTTEKIQPVTENVISFNRTYSNSSEPTVIADDKQPQFATGDSFSCVDGYYNKAKYANGKDSSFNNIQININNDIIYYQYLVWQTLKNIMVVNNAPVIGAVYISLEQASWSMNLSLSYNVVTQTFDYIQFNITADGDWTVFKQVASICINYAWGNSAAAIAKGFPVLKQFDSNNDNSVSYHTFTIPDNVGPKLLGAYSIYRGNNIYLQHQPPDAKAPFYTQNFLSLVPSAPDVNNVDSKKNSYQFYDVCVFVRNSIFQMICGKYISSGYHVYFGKQPRMLGLEYIAGSGNLAVHYPPTGQTFRDSFANWGLALPSYSLTNVSYLGNEQYQLPSAIPDIAKCKVNIDTISPQIQNKSTYDNYKGSDNGGYNNTFEWRYLDHFFDAFDYNCDPSSSSSWHYTDVNDPNNPLYPGYGDFFYDLDGDKTTAHTIDPCGTIANQRFNNRLKDLQDKTDAIIGGWQNNITITDDAGTNTKADNIPWWQVIQVRSQRSGDLTPEDDNCRNFSCINNKWRTGGLSSFVSDQTNNSKFTRFAIGLNYMFNPSTDCKISEDSTNWDPNNDDDSTLMADNMFLYQGTYLTNITYSDS